MQIFRRKIVLSDALKRLMLRGKAAIAAGIAGLGVKTRRSLFRLSYLSISLLYPRV